MLCYTLLFAAFITVAPSLAKTIVSSEVIESDQDIDVDPNKIRCRPNERYICNPRNKNSFYQCAHGTPYLHYCPAGLVFNSKLNVCAFTGTPCRSTVTESLTPEQRCANGETIWAHPDECALFFNCSLVYTTVPRYFEQHMDECPYPQLFNSVTMRCEDFEGVTCGTRKEPKAGCDYRRNKCPTSHCRPCELDYPSCVNASDGPYFDSQRLWTPTYVECKQGRSMGVKQCMPMNGIPQIFSPESLKCVSAMLPDFNDPRPDCTGKPDGLYQEENGRCDIHILCLNQRYVGYGYCPLGKKFDGATRSCKLPAEICPPCGTNKNACI